MNKKFWDALREELKVEQWAYLEDEEDRVWYFQDSTTVDSVVDFIERKAIEFEESIDQKRAHYFAMRDMLWANGNTGYSKIELHELAKKVLFPYLGEDPSNFIEGGKEQKGFSVTWLSEKGWDIYNEAFRLWAFENFNFYL